MPSTVRRGARASASPRTTSRSLPARNAHLREGEEGRLLIGRTSARVVAAVDGDTLKVDLKNGGEWDVRLIGIDTPETVRPNTPVQCGGPQASTSMHGLADGRHVTLVSDPTQDRVDRYGRLLDYVFRGHENLGKVQLRRGWAEVYVYQHNPFEKVHPFKHAEHRAEHADRGVWKDCGGDFHTPQ